MNTRNVRDQQESLEEALRKLVVAYSPERVYLFGSTARGDTSGNSDFDLMIIVPDDVNPERKRSRLGYMALRGTGTAADILVWTKKYFDDRVHLKASLPATILREGELLYAS
ncbi:MAG: nucleotidyltransferase domain-containing protein [Ignavibacteriae bacterium]|nr:nucleotidyltransferase domain-containing protein [Ignavibacteriota bacterium]